MKSIGECRFGWIGLIEVSFLKINPVIYYTQKGGVVKEERGKSLCRGQELGGGVSGFCGGIEVGERLFCVRELVLAGEGEQLFVFVS